MPTRCIAVLGRRDQPTDAVEEYCRFLQAALSPLGFSLEIARVRWKELGRAASLREFRDHLGHPQNDWYLLQYTALAWSERGFPTRVRTLVKLLKGQNARCAVVFHDAAPYRGHRWIDRLRRTVQLFVMRELLRLTDVAIFTVPLNKISWLPAQSKNAVFIPVGANLPAPERAWAATKNSPTPAVAIFSITGPPRTRPEVRLISDAVLFASKQIGAIRVLVFGRNADVSGQQLKTALSNSPAEVSVMGLIPADEIVRLLGSCDVLLFVRGHISTRRGSAIAGIACGLPVIAEEGPETAPPITEAGVVLVPPDRPDQFGPALLRVLSDPVYRASLAERSRNAQERYFSWPTIAAQYAQILRDAHTVRPLPPAK